MADEPNEVPRSEKDPIVPDIGSDKGDALVDAKRENEGTADPPSNHEDPTPDTSEESDDSSEISSNDDPVVNLPEPRYGTSLVSQSSEADSDHDSKHHGDDHYYDDYHHDEYHYDDEYHQTSTQVDSSAASVPGHQNQDYFESSEDEEENGEDYGGPIKGFLEHLEDLRWVLIKSLTAVMIAMIVCLVAADRVIEILKEPLLMSQSIRVKDKNYAHLFIGTNKLGSLEINTNKLGQLTVPTNSSFAVHIQPFQVGTNQVFGFNLSTNQLGTSFSAPTMQLKNYSPVEGFIVALQLALYGGIGLASPFVLFFIGDFVLPALKRKERSMLLKAVVIGAFLFALGVCFCYFMMLHVALYAAQNFSNWLSFGADEWRASSYIGFICKFMLGMGIGFELPVVILSLVKLNLVSYQQLAKGRPYWLVVNMVLSSMLTPPDPATMLLMALPLQILYEASVFIAWIWDRRDRKRLAAEEAEEAKES
jgi:sec-independent protein translocase protein TatC